MVNPISPSPDLAVTFWDLRPREVVEIYNATPKSVPLAMLGDPGGEVVFASTNLGVATVDGGLLRYGTNPGAAVIIAEAVSDGQVISRRYLQVDIFRSTSTPSAPTLDWQPSGYVELVDDGTWHFRYFDEWYDSNGGNRLQGCRFRRAILHELSLSVCSDVTRFSTEALGRRAQQSLGAYTTWAGLRTRQDQVDVLPPEARRRYENSKHNH